MMGRVLEVHEGNNIQRGRAFCRGMAINWGGWMNGFFPCTSGRHTVKASWSEEVKNGV